MAKINPIIIVGGVAVAGVAGYALYKTMNKEEEKTGGSSGSSMIMPDLSFMGDLFSGMQSTGSFSNITDQVTKYVQDSSAKIISLIPTAEDIQTAANDAVKNLIPDIDPLGDLKDKVSDAGNFFKDLIPEKIDININTPWNKGSSGGSSNNGGFLNSGIDLGKAGIVATAGWGAAGLLSGVSAPFLPFLAAAGGVIAGANALRQKTISSTGKTPEQNVVDAVKNLIPGSSGSKNKSVGSPVKVAASPAAINVSQQSKALSGVDLFKSFAPVKFGSGSFSGKSGYTGSW